eukprot:2038636-Amphidinium_carterae.1
MRRVWALVAASWRAGQDSSPAMGSGVGTVPRLYDPFLDLSCETTLVSGGCVLRHLPLQCHPIVFDYRPVENVLELIH